MSDEETDVLSPSIAFDAYQVALQEAAVQATKSAVALPRDLSFHRSLDRKFGKCLDACSARVLSLTTKLLEYVEAEEAAGKGKGKRRLDSEEDVVDGFHLLIVDAMDRLLERADSCLDEFLGRTKPAAIAVNPQARPRSKATKPSHGRLDPAITHASHMPKPQLLFRTPVDNSNTSVLWLPRLKTKPHALIPLDQSFLNGVTHPYQHEITHYVAPPHLLEPPPPPVPPEPLTTAQSVTYIANAEQLPVLLGTLKEAREIAVDLEHHSYRSFAGFACLMQISTRTQDWIIDCLDPGVREELQCLNEVFANPQIVKVFHGAESDVVWLQQNFYLYIVNLFDTYHATKVLDFPKHSLAALLEMYCDFTPDKRFQLADWRIRPLPEQMLLYARADTHFLLFIYDNLRRALAPAALMEVLRRSSETALRTYAQAQDPGGWEVLERRWNRSLTGVRGAVFRAVHAWRERVARSEDESVRYVLANHYVFQIAERLPVDLAALFALFQGVPPLVRTHAAELLAVIREAVQNAAPGEESASGISDDSANTASANDESALHTRAELEPEHVRVAGRSVAGLWDRLQPTAASGSLPNISSSSTLFGPAASNTAPTPPVSYAASTSTLLGTPAPIISDARYHDLVARIHSSLIVAPALAAVRTQPTEETAAPTTTSPSPPPPPAISDPVVQAEIPFVPREQRHTDPNTGDGIVVVGRSRKRKRQDANVSTSSKKANASPPEDVPDFDYDAIPNLLDEPVPPPAQVPRTKKRREKGGGVKNGGFGAAPRNMSEVKGGNQARTFR